MSGGFAGGSLQVSEVPWGWPLWCSQWSTVLLEGSSCQLPLKGLQQAGLIHLSLPSSALCSGHCLVPSTPRPYSYHAGKPAAQRNTSFQTHQASCFSPAEPSLCVAERLKKKQEGMRDGRGEPFLSLLSWLIRLGSSTFTT